MRVGAKTPVEIGILCSDDMADLRVLKKLITHLSVAIKQQMGEKKKITVNDLPVGEDIDSGLLSLLECDFLLIILSIDILADEKGSLFLDLLLHKLEQVETPLYAIYIYARTVNVENVPQPSVRHLLIKPRTPLVLCSNQDECYEHLCELLAMRIELISIKIKTAGL